MSIRYQKGFTLVGVLAAIFIISIGLVAILSLVSLSLRSSSVGETRLVASGLAQEGIEIVRDIRRANPNWIDWDWYGNGGAIATSTTQNYRVQYNNPIFLPFAETLLKIDTDGFYQYDIGDNTIFYRQVILTKVSFQEVKVVVEIKWQLRGNWHYLTAEDHLWNWK